MLVRVLLLRLNAARAQIAQSQIIFCLQVLVGLPGKIADSNLDFLTGSMSSFAQSKAQQNALREPVPSLYVQDTYHLNSHMVLSGGVRWDPMFMATDYFGRGSQFSMANFMANKSSVAYPNTPAGSLYYGDPGVPKAYIKNTVWQFSPRVGATFDPTGHGQTVFRIGAAMVYDTPNLFTDARNQQNSPFGLTVANTAVGGPLSFTSPWSNGVVTTNPFSQPPTPSKNVAFAKGGQYFVLPAQFHDPYVIQWTTSVQHEFGQGWQVQLDYVGN